MNNKRRKRLRRYYQAVRMRANALPGDVSVRKGIADLRAMLERP